MIEILLKIDDGNITLNEKTLSSRNRPDIPYSEVLDNLEEDTSKKDIHESFTDNKTNNKKTTPGRRVRQKEIKIDKYVYRNILYTKIGNMFIRFHSDNTCEQIGGSTYYKYKAREKNDA